MIGEDSGAVHAHSAEHAAADAGAKVFISGRPATFLLAVAVVIFWSVTGPLFGFQRHLATRYTGTTIVTFLMVFLIQPTQNRDTLALQLKLDELILATKNARNQIAGIEEAPDEEIESSQEEVLERAG